MSGEAGPWGPTPTRRGRGRRATARRLGREGWALWTVAGSRHPDPQVNVGAFSREGANIFVFLGEKKTHSAKSFALSFVSAVCCVSSNNSAPKPSWCLGLMRVSPLSLFNQCYCGVTIPVMDCTILFSAYSGSLSVPPWSVVGRQNDARVHSRPLCSPSSHCVCSTGWRMSRWPPLRSLTTCCRPSRTSSWISACAVCWSHCNTQPKVCGEPDDVGSTTLSTHASLSSVQILKNKKDALIEIWIFQIICRCSV